MNQREQVAVELPAHAGSSTRRHIAEDGILQCCLDENLVRGGGLFRNDWLPKSFNPKKYLAIQYQNF
jgi:hypothetical protein